MKIFTHLIFYFTTFFLLTGTLAGCGTGFSPAEETSTGEKATSASITLASWNTQTFFDARTEGTEYDDFKKNGNWSRDKYLVRLGRLCEVMTSLNADVFVLQEIENAAVVQDIANQLAGKSLSKNKRWDYAAFAKEEGASIGCAVFSRHKISDITTHSMDIRCQQTDQPSCRPVMQFTVEAGEHELVVLVNHWKSKLGTDESRIWRQWQESLACARIGKVPALVLCGDFNQDAKEFVTSFDGNTNGNVIFRGIDITTGALSTVKVHSPWFTQNGSFSTKNGSYYYQGEWERIDHIFSAGNARLAAFSPRAESPWADTDGRPVSYRIYNGEGYSDHLPVMCTVSF